VAAGAETLEYFVKIWSLGKSRNFLNLQIGGLMVAHDDVHICFLDLICCCWICALDGFDVVMGFVGLL
jgi:hypothetical protein